MTVEVQTVTKTRDRKSVTTHRNEAQYECSPDLDCLSQQFRTYRCPTEEGLALASV